MEVFFSLSFWHFVWEIGARQAKLTPLRMPDVWQPCSAMLENYQMSSSSSEDKHLAGPDEKEIKWRTLESPKSTVRFQFGDCIGSINFRVLWGYRSSFLKPRLTGTWKIKQTCRLQGRLCNLWTSLRKFIHSLLIRETLSEKIGIFVLLQFTGGFSNLRLIQEICMLTLKLDPQPCLSESKTKFDCVWSWFLSSILIHMYHLLVLYLRCLYMTLL